MFSQLGSLFQTQIRQAEPNDARQQIPHEERDNHRKNKDDTNKEDEPTQKWTDDTVVSIPALHSFLINFIKTLPDTEDSAFLQRHDKSNQISTRPKEEVRPSNTHNAKAVRAYQTMASHCTVDIKEEEEDNNIEPPSNNDPTVDKLQSKELRDLHQLIIDLEYLQSKNIENLNILKAESFIEGMKNAVRLIKSKI